MQDLPCSPSIVHRNHRDGRHGGRLHGHLHGRHGDVRRDVHDAFRE